MGAAYFIVLAHNIDGLDSGMDGKSLSRHIASLDQAALDSGVRPLSEFFSVSPDEAAAFLQAEGLEMGELKIPPLQQFSAEEGLATVRALKAHPTAQKDNTLRDLDDCERILGVAARHGVDWHFEVDF